MVKDIVLSRLAIREGFGYVHFSKDLDDEYFNQLTAEVVKVRYKKGRKYREYVQIRERNEALDCMVYATAALMILNPVLSVVKAKTQQPPRVESDVTSPIQQPARPARRPILQRKGGWMSL